MAEASHLRPRTFFEILDGSVRHYRAHFLDFLLPFLPAAAISLISSLLSTGMQAVALGTPGGDPDPEMLTSFMSIWGLVFLFSTIMMLAFALGYGATVFQAAADLEGRVRLAPRAAWRLASGRFWALVGLSILVTWIIGFGFLFLIIPGIYLTIRFGVSAQVLLLEGTNVGDALGRSGDLLKGNYRRGLGVIVFLYVLMAAFSVLPFAMGMGAVFLMNDEGEIGNSLAYFLMVGVGDVISVAVGALVWPLMSLAVTHFYWDLRVRKEGLDLQAKLERLEPTSP